MSRFLSLCCFCTLLILGGTMSSCKTKEGCAVNQEVHVNMDKKRYKSKSRLFPKNAGKRR